MYTNEIHRGDIFFSDLDPVAGSEQGGMRPVLVIQNEASNRSSPTVIVAPITSRLRKKRFPTHVLLPEETALPARSLVLLEHIRTIDKSRLGRYVAAADEETMQAVDSALCRSLGLSRPKKPGPADDLRLFLCPSCLTDFFRSGTCQVRRADPFRKDRNTCSCCQVRPGYEYVITKTAKREDDAGF